MTRNVGGIDRIVRVIVGLGLIRLAFDSYSGRARLGPSHLGVEPLTEGRERGWEVEVLRVGPCETSSGWSTNSVSGSTGSKPWGCCKVLWLPVAMASSAGLLQAVP